MGDTNFKVYKIEDENRTKTCIEKIKGDDLIREIARMLSGENITDSSLAHAKELLSRS